MSIYVRDADGNRQKIAGVGLPGPAGKSAYQYAVEGGFSGTEEEFRAVVGVRSNPNLLDNWYFADPINQRGQTEYTVDGYTIDRWISFYGNAEVQIGADGVNLAIQIDGAWFAQQIRPGVLNAGDVCTFSVLTTEGLFFGTETLIADGNYHGSILIGDNFYSQYIFENGSYRFAIIKNWSNTPASITLIAAKLELGPVQTLAHKDAFGNWVLNDPPPNKALELAKCQRYFQRLNIIRPKEVGIQWLFADFKTTMRINPTIVNIISDPPNAEITYTASKDSVRFKSDTISYFEVMSFDANADL